MNFPRYLRQDPCFELIVGILYYDPANHQAQSLHRLSDEESQMRPQTPMYQLQPMVDNLCIPAVCEKVPKEAEERRIQEFP